MKKHYLPLWSLLTVSFIAFFVISVYGGPRIGNVELLTTKMYQTLTHMDTCSSPVSEPSPENDSEVIAAPPAPVPVLDTASQTILLIGDSMLGGISPRLAAYAKENGHKLHTYIQYCSSSKHWATSGNLEKCLEKVKPTYIFIALGTNELYIKNIIETRAEYVKTIVNKFGDIPYVWIGPPNWKKDSGINELLKQIVPADKFFLSKGMKFKYYEDQIHPTMSSSAQWVDSVVRWMPKHCMHQIILNPPVAKTAKPDVHVVLKKPTN